MSYKIGSSELEAVCGPPPGPAATKKERERYLEDLTLARLARIPESVYRTLKDNGVWISDTPVEDTPVSTLALKRKRSDASKRAKARQKAKAEAAS
jgi:hypothetical protein